MSATGISTQQNAARIVLLIAAIVDAYFAAPYLMMPWVRAIPPLRFGMTMEMPLYGIGRWVAVGSVVVMWVLLNRRSTFRQWLSYWLLGSLLLQQLSTVVVLANDMEVWFIPDEYSFYVSDLTRYWSHLLVMPVNLLTVGLGVTIDYRKTGHFVTHVDTYTAQDYPSVPEGIFLHWALLVLLWLVGGFVFWKLMTWIGRKMQVAQMLPDDRVYTTMRRGWTALLLLVFYSNTVVSTFPHDEYEALKSLLNIGETLLLTSVTALLLTPLFFRLARLVLEGQTARRPIGKMLVCVCVLFAVLFAGAGIRELVH